MPTEATDIEYVHRKAANEKSASIDVDEIAKEFYDYLNKEFNSTPSVKKQNETEFDRNNNKSSLDDDDDEFWWTFQWVVFFLAPEVDLFKLLLLL